MENDHKEIILTDGENVRRLLYKGKMTSNWLSINVLFMYTHEKGEKIREHRITLVDCTFYTNTLTKRIKLNSSLEQEWVNDILPKQVIYVVILAVKISFFWRVNFFVLMKWDVYFHFIDQYWMRQAASDSRYNF